MTGAGRQDPAAGFLPASRQATNVCTDCHGCQGTVFWQLNRGGSGCNRQAADMLGSYTENFIYINALARDSRPGLPAIAGLTVRVDPEG